MIKVKIKVKELQAVKQAARDLHTRSANAYISKGNLFFEVEGERGYKKTIKLEGMESGK